MLKRAAVADLSSGRVTRADGRIVVVMRFYPRGLARAMRDEYCRELAPPGELFAEFKARERALGDHDRAFAEVQYEQRFWLTNDGLAELRRLSAATREQPVILICQCKPEQRCHGDLLLLMAARLNAAPVLAPALAYPVFQARLEAWAADF